MPPLRIISGVIDFESAFAVFHGGCGVHIAVFRDHFIGAVLLGNAIKAARADDRVVSVKGLCEREVKADNVICPFAYKEGGDDLGQLYKTKS